MSVIDDDEGDVIQNVDQSFLPKGLKEEIRMSFEEKFMEWEVNRTTADFPGETPLAYKDWKVLTPGRCGKLKFHQ
eukprot:14775288-Ditylum_brightwellii.AAC.1